MSYIQMIAAVAVVGIFSGVAMMKMSNVSDSAEEQRLNVHVASLNSAVKLYVSSGGSLEDLTSAQAVVDKMKSLASNSDKIAGFGGTLIDPRLTAVQQTDQEAADGELRVVWNAAEKTFKLESSGAKGIKEFKIDPTATPSTIAAEERSSMFELAATDSTQGAWVWDYNTDTSASASPIVTTAGGDTGLDINPNGSNSSKNQLLQPSVDPLPSTFNLDQFGTAGMAVQITNPNSANVSELKYSIDGGSWETIADEDSVTVPPGGSLSVFAIVNAAGADDHFNSYVRSGRYEGTTTNLTVPSIQTSAPAFHPLDQPTIEVSATHSNDTEHSKVQVQIGTGGWVDYTSPILLDLADHIPGTDVYARVVAKRWPKYYVASPVVEKPLPTIQHTLDEPSLSAAPLQLHPIDSDVVTVTVTDPNPAGISRIQYSLAGGDWVDYVAPFSLQIDDFSDGVDIETKAIPIIYPGALLESDDSTGTVVAVDVTLDEPTISLSAADFHPIDHQTVTATLTNPNPASVSALEYQINEGDWQSYSAPVVFDLVDHLAGIDLNARSVATAHPANLLSSGAEAVNIGVEEATLVEPSIASSAPVLNPQGYPTATITLSSSNSAAFAKLVYSLDGEETWEDYTGAFVLSVSDYPEGVNIIARAEAIVIPELIHNSANEELELPVPPKLDAPTFARAAGEYVKSEFDQGIALTNPNSSESSTLMYRVNGGTWEEYTDSVVLASWPATIEAYAAASSYLSYQDSDYSEAEYERIYLTPALAFTAEASGLPFLTHEFTGEAFGEFKDPEGDSGMVYVLDNNYFEWGESTGYLGFDNGSYLEYSGAAWDSVQAGELFRLGTLDYFNGSTWSGTMATDVTLDLTIALSMPDTNQSFDIDIELENTTNSSNNTEDQNADYVRISSLDTNFSTTIDGIQYQLNLAFGYKGNQGFTTIDEFHVHEGASTTADLWGYFTTDDF